MFSVRTHTHTHTCNYTHLAVRRRDVMKALMIYGRRCRWRRNYIFIWANLDYVRLGATCLHPAERWPVAMVTELSSLQCSGGINRCDVSAGWTDHALSLPRRRFLTYRRCDGGNKINDSRSEFKNNDESVKPRGRGRGRRWCHRFVCGLQFLKPSGLSVLLTPSWILANRAEPRTSEQFVGAIFFVYN